MVALFDAGEESIHVDMDDLAQAAAGRALVIIVVGTAITHAGIDSEPSCKSEPLPPPDALCRCERNS